MSKNISIKINSGKETAETVKLNTAANKLVIKAQPNVNYELVDDSTQFAPEEIQTKRVGDDLHIAFEGTDIQQNSDLVLEGYYTSDNTELLVGMAENGQYYAYVPQSGEQNDAVTLLADQMFAPQALGGEKLAAAFWAFNPNWLWAAEGVAAVGGIIAAASGSHGGSSHTADNETQPNKPNDNTPPTNETPAPSEPMVPPVEEIRVPHAPSLVAKARGVYIEEVLEVTPPSEDDVQHVVLEYENSFGDLQTITISKNEEGIWTTPHNRYVELDPQTGKAVISNVGEHSVVKAISVNQAGANSVITQETVLYRKVYANSATWVETQEHSIILTETQDGLVNVEPSIANYAETKTFEVSYIDKNGSQQKVIATKDDLGHWSIPEDSHAVVDVMTGKISLPAYEVQVDSLKARMKDSDGVGLHSWLQADAHDVDTYVAQKTKQVLTPPTVTASTEDGSVTITVAEDAKVGDRVEVAMLSEDGIYAGKILDRIYLTKESDGSWTSTAPQYLPNIPAGQNSTTIPENKLYDGAEVTAMSARGKGHDINLEDEEDDFTFSLLARAIAGSNRGEERKEPNP